MSTEAMEAGGLSKEIGWGAARHDDAERRADHARIAVSLFLPAERAQTAY
jgi:hypothetical protein